MAHHAGHHMIMIDGLDNTLRTGPALSDKYRKIEKDINGAIDTLIAELQGLKKAHNEHVVSHTQGGLKHSVLRRKLLNREPLELREATGDAVASMLQELKEVEITSNLYQRSPEEVEKCITSSRQRFQEITAELQALWKVGSANFVSRQVSVKDVTGLASTTAGVSFKDCKSKEWLEIGKHLSTIPSLITFSAEGCDSGDGLCAGVSNSKSLRELRLGK